MRVRAVSKRHGDAAGAGDDRCPSAGNRDTDTPASPPAASRFTERLELDGPALFVVIGRRSFPNCAAATPARADDAAADDIVAGPARSGEERAEEDEGEVEDEEDEGLDKVVRVARERREIRRRVWKGVKKGIRWGLC